MTRRRTIVSIGIACLFLAFPAISFACSHLSAMSLSGETGRPGSVITVYGRQWDAGRQVTVNWGTADGPQLGTGIGPDFETSVTIPNASGGFYSIVTVERNSAGVIDWQHAATFAIPRVGASSSPPPGPSPSPVVDGAPILKSGSGDSPSTAGALTTPTRSADAAPNDQNSAPSATPYRFTAPANSLAVRYTPPIHNVSGVAGKAGEYQPGIQLPSGNSQGVTGDLWGAFRGRSLTQGPALTGGVPRATISPLLLISLLSLVMIVITLMAVGMTSRRRAPVTN